MYMSVDFAGRGRGPADHQRLVKTWKEEIIPMTRLKRIIGVISGSVIQRSRCHARGLSSSAASRRP